MKPKTFRAHSIGVLTYLAGIPLAVINTSLPVSAQVSNPDPVHIEMTVLDGNSVAVGEPLVLRYTIANTSNQEVLYLRGVRQCPQFTADLVDMTGRTPLTVPRTNLTNPRGARMGVGEYGVLHPNSSSQGYVVVAQPDTSLHPGQYTVIVHIQSPCLQAPALTTPTADIAANAPRYVVTQDFSLPLQLAPSNETHLRGTAERLRQRAESATRADDQATFTEALLSLPESAALSIWQALVTDPTTPAGVLGVAATQWAASETQTTADLLAGMAWTPAQPAGTAPISQARDSLKTLYDRTADPRLKRHIKTIFADHGVALPEEKYVLTTAD